MMIMNRRKLLTGALAAPLVIPAFNLMPLRGIIMPFVPPSLKVYFRDYTGALAWGGELPVISEGGNRIHLGSVGFNHFMPSVRRPSEVWNSAYMTAEIERPWRADRKPLIGEVNVSGPVCAGDYQHVFLSSAYIDRNIPGGF